MLAMLVRWWRWQLCVAAWVGSMRHDHQRGGVTYAWRHDFLPRRVEQRCQRHGFDPELALEAPVAKIDGKAADLRHAHGLGPLQAPTQRSASSFQPPWRAVSMLLLYPAAPL